MLDAILGGKPTSTTKSTVDTSAGLEPVGSGPNPEEEIINEAVEAEDVEPNDTSSQELSSTPVSAVALW